MRTVIKHKMIKYFSIVLIVFSIHLGQAQQDPQFTHYMYNMSVINPAYATETQDVVNLGGIYRAQWVGIKGAPTTQSFFAHKAMAKKVEMGLSMTHDEIGDVVRESNIFADFAYVLKLSQETKLSFGVKAGVTLFNTDFNGFQFSSALVDPAFQDNVSKVFPNIGAGTYLFGSNYYLGFSAPNLFSSKHIENTNGIVAQGVEDVHYFMTGGYVLTFNGNDNFKVKPAFMAKGVSGAPIALDLTTNVLINNKFEAGVGYRLGDSVSGLASFYVTPQLRIGYSYDYTLTNLRNYNTGSHEVFVLFNLDLNRFSNRNNNGYYKSPRFF